MHFCLLVYWITTCIFSCGSDVTNLIWCIKDWVNTIGSRHWGILEVFATSAVLCFFYDSSTNWYPNYFFSTFLWFYLPINWVYSPVPCRLCTCLPVLSLKWCPRNQLDLSPCAKYCQVAGGCCLVQQPACLCFGGKYLFRAACSYTSDKSLCTHRNWWCFLPDISIAVEMTCASWFGNPWLRNVVFKVC